MKTTRTINPSDIRLIYFGTKDALENNEAKEVRKSKLRNAVSQPKSEEMLINILMKLPNGETVETQSSLIDCRDEFVVLKGGHTVPVTAIVDIVG